MRVRHHGPVAERVGDAQPQLGRQEVQADLDRDGTGVPPGIGQGLLQDAVHGETQTRREGRCDAADLHAEVEPGPARLLEEGRHVVEPPPTVHRLVTEQVHQPL
jgi:hypothetical protein